MRRPAAVGCEAAAEAAAEVRPSAMKPGRDIFLAQPDEKLLAECAVETYRSSGPGGQHRNKRDSAVRLTHRPTGVVVTATERRSQHENRHRALARLRRAIAFRVRQTVSVPRPAVPRCVPEVSGTQEKVVIPSERSESRNLAVQIAKRQRPRRDPSASLGVTSKEALPENSGASVPSALGRALADPGWPRISQKSEAYLPAAAQVLDFLEAMEGKTSDVAACLGASTASLVKFLHLDDDLWEEANRIRRRFGHAPLR